MRSIYILQTFIILCVILLYIMYQICLSLKCESLKTALKFVSVQALVKLSEVLKLKREEMNAFSVDHCCWCQLPRSLAKMQAQIN